MARRSGVTIRARSHPAIERFFAGLDVIEPGVLPLPRWRPEPAEADDPERPTDTAVSVYGGVARVP